VTPRHAMTRLGGKTSARRPASPPPAAARGERCRWWVGKGACGNRRPEERKVFSGIALEQLCVDNICLACFPPSTAPFGHDRLRESVKRDLLTWHKSPVTIRIAVWS